MQNYESKSAAIILPRQLILDITKKANYVCTVKLFAMWKAEQKLGENGKIASYFSIIVSLLWLYRYASLFLLIVCFLLSESL